MSDDFDSTRDFFAGCTDEPADRPLVLLDVHLLFAGRTAVEIVKATVEGEGR
jgi:hypothetical protein